MKKKALSLITALCTAVSFVPADTCNAKGYGVLQNLKSELYSNGAEVYAEQFKLPEPGKNLSVNNTSAGKRIYVTNTNDNANGEGSKENPYRSFESAVAAASDGDTIVLSEKGVHIGTSTEDELKPLVISKSLTIEGESGNPSFSLWKAGILLEADVTFKNITFEFANKCYAAVFANGHTLTLDNVKKGSGTRLVHLFAGNLHVIGGTTENPIATPFSNATGSHGQIVVSGASEFGNIYAGSMNGSFEKPVTLTLSGGAGSRLGSVYACGALQGRYDDNTFLSQQEPTDPFANSGSFPSNGKISINLNNFSVKEVNGTANTSGNKASLTFSTVYPDENLSLSNISSLIVKSGILKPSSLNQYADIEIQSGGVLDLSTVTVKSGNVFYISNFTGGGTLKLSKDACLNIYGSLKGSTLLQISGALSGSAAANEDHKYIKYSRGDGIFTFTPHSSQTGLKLVKENKSWKTSYQQNTSDSSSSTTETPVIRLKKFTVSPSSLSVKKADINSISGAVFKISCDVLNAPANFSISSIPFAFEAEYNGKSYTSVIKDLGSGSYEASIDDLNMKFSPSGSVVKITGTSGSINVGVYDITITASTELGALSRKLKLNVTEEAETPQNPDSANTDTPNNDSGGETQEKTEKSISLSQTLGGKISADKTAAKKGETVTVTLTPAENYIVYGLNVTDSKGNKISSSKSGEGIYVFTMPADSVKAEGIFTSENQNQQEAQISVPFSDVQKDSWYSSAVSYVFANGLMKGLDERRFAPNDTLSRAMITQILYNKDGNPEPSGTARFNDVAGGSWYESSVKWAASKGIIGGYPGGDFGPNDYITREQLSVILWRYAGSPQSKGDLSKFTDVRNVSEYAQSALKWAVENNIISGMGDGTLNPGGNASRAQVASVIMRFVELSLKNS